MLTQNFSALKKISVSAVSAALFMAFGISSAFASTVTRSFDAAAVAPGDSVIVSLAVGVTAPDTFYIIDETLPAGWTISAPGTGDTAQAGHIKWAVLSGAASTNLQYTVSVPASASGVNTFSGEFAFDSNPVPVAVLGATDVTVSAPSGPSVLNSINVIPAASSIEVGTTLQLSIEALDQNGAAIVDPAMSLIWTTSDPLIVDVDPNGLVTAVSPGFATITAIAIAGNGLDIAIGTADITVPIPAAGASVLTSVIITPDVAAIDVGATLQFSASPLDQDDAPFVGATISWISGDPAIAAVDANGLVTGVAPGTATIFVVAEDGVIGGAVSSATITVNAPVSAPVLTTANVTPTIASIVAGTTQQLAISILDQNGAPFVGATVTWVSSNSTIATVNVNGLVTGVAAGAAIITASVTDGITTLTSASDIIVSVPPSVLTSVSVSPATTSILDGATTQLTVSPLDQNGAAFVGATVSFSSSDPAVATVDANGLVTGVSAGTASVTASATDGVNTVTGSSIITVTAVPPADIISPVITIIGDNPVTVLQNAVYADAGATAADDVDGNLTANIVVTGLPLDTSAVGTFAVVYSVSDVAGNTATATRTVDVIAAPVQIPEVNRIELVLVSPTIEVGATTIVNADVFDQNGIRINPTPTINWSVDNPTVASIGSQQIITGLSAGTAVITASIGNISTNATLTVVAAQISPILTSVTVLPASATVDTGSTSQLSASALDQNGASFVGSTITWTSSDPAVATVDANGLVTGVSAGSASVTASATDGVITVTGASTITINAPAPISVLTSVAVSLATVSTFAGATTQLTASPLDQNGAAFVGATISFSSSDPAVASVDAAGLVTGIAPGTATITASVLSGAVTVTGTSAINVLPDTASRVTRSFDTVTPAPGSSVVVSLAVNVSTPDTFYIIDETLPVGWTITDPGTGDISQAGHIKWAVLSGAVSTALQYTVTAPAIEGLSVFSGEFGFDSTPTPAAILGATNVTVISPASIPVLTSIGITPAVASIEIGATSQLAASALNQNGALFVVVGANIVWSSSDSAVATVDANGLITAVSAGTAVITAADGLISGSASITVTAFVPVLTSVSVSPATMTTLIGGTLQLSVSPLAQNGSAFVGATTTWSSSDPNIVTVDANGSVTGVAVGSATITATAVSGAASITSTSTITVLSAGASIVTRSFSATVLAPGSSLIVSLAVDVPALDTFYLIDEILPAGWTVIDPGTGDTTQAGHIKWAVLSGASSTVLQYTIQAPAGAVTNASVFSGEFGFDSNAVPVPTLGATTVNVDATSPSIPLNPVALVSSDTQIDLSWATSTDNIAVREYQIFRNGSSTPIATTTATTFSDTGLEVGTPYTYTVSAVDTVGNTSELSALVSAKTTDTAPVPGVPGIGGGGGGGGGSGGGGGGGSSFGVSPLAFAAATPAQVASTVENSGQVLGAAIKNIFTRDLREGMSGDDVRELQHILADEGLFGGPFTGYFGPLTRQAVIEYQEKNREQVLQPAGLSRGTGYVGQYTRTFLSGRTNRGSQGAPVSQKNNGAQLALLSSLQSQLLNLNSRLNASPSGSSSAGNSLSIADGLTFLANLQRQLTEISRLNGLTPISAVNTNQ